MEDRIKEIKQPLGLYDFFGYLLPGFFLFCLLIIDFDGSKILRYYIANHTLKGIENQSNSYTLKYLLDFINYKATANFGIIQFIIFLFFCYLSGHIMASFSSLLSKHIIKRFLKHPSDNLFPNYSQTEDLGLLYKIVAAPYRCLRYVVGKMASLNYKRAFDSEFIAIFKTELQSIYGYEVKRGDYYWLTYTYICANHPELVKRVQHFVNLSGFLRNITGTIIFYLILRILVLSLVLGCNIDSSVKLILTSYTLLMLVTLWSHLRLHKRQAVDMYYIFISLIKKKN